MRISVIGTGYLGAVHAAAMAAQGHDVVAVDVDVKKIDALASGRAPFYEPGFDDLLAEVAGTGRLTWTTDVADAADARVHFLCVGTPQRAGMNSADLTYVWSAVEALLPYLKPGSVLAGKSTVPVGTADEIAQLVAESWSGDAEEMPVVVWNPEFLREGFAVEDTLRPDRIVVGLPSAETSSADDQTSAAADVEARTEKSWPAADAQRGRDQLVSEAARQYAAAAMREVYAPQVVADIPYLETDRPTAELVKVAANAFLATKISFINAMAEVCEATGADVVTLADAIGHDERIGRRFLGAGVGFGGGCLPKDIRAFSARAGELGVYQALTFLREIDDINTRRRYRAIETARRMVGGSFRGRRVCVLGAAFKPNSDDVRDSPALDIAAQIHNEGGDVVVHDPKALDNAAARFPALSYQPDLAEALSGAEVVLLLTEWAQYRELDPEATARLVASPRILDGRNVLDGQLWRDAGWSIRGMGREHGQ